MILREREGGRETELTMRVSWLSHLQQHQQQYRESWQRKPVSPRMCWFVLFNYKTFNVSQAWVKCGRRTRRLPPGRECSVKQRGNYWVWRGEVRWWLPRSCKSCDTQWQSVTVRPRCQHHDYASRYFPTSLPTSPSYHPRRDMRRAMTSARRIPLESSILCCRPLVSEWSGW